MIIFAIVSILLVLIAILVLSILQIDFGLDSFYSFTIIDIATLLITVVLGFCVTYFVSVVVTKRQRKHDVMNEVYEMYQEAIKSIISKVYSLKNQVLSKEVRDWFLASFTATRNNFDILMTLYKDEKIKIDSSFETSFSNFQETIISEDFIADKKVFDDLYVIRCMNAYSIAKRELFKTKLQLHNK